MFMYYYYCLYNNNYYYSPRGPSEIVVAGVLYINSDIQLLLVHLIIKLQFKRHLVLYSYIHMQYADNQRNLPHAVLSLTINNAPMCFMWNII